VQLDVLDVVAVGVSILVLAVALSFIVIIWAAAMGAPALPA
jgi:hypothetical protein